MRKREAAIGRSGREKIADALDLSKEVLLGVTKIVVLGEHEISVENYKHIIEYNTKCIRIKGDKKIIKIDGENLEIKTMSEGFLYITGIIFRIFFEEQ